jgi:release factor glutamine methyltransferase
MTIAEALREAARQLAAVSDSARLDAELLMAEALGASRSDMLLRHQRDTPPQGFAALVERRLRHEPVAQILGRKEFYGLDLVVTPDVLIPRADSETLVDAARAALAERPPLRVLDLGTGSGALLLATLTIWPEARGVGIDRDTAALAVAAANAARLGLRERALLRARNWTDPGWRDDLGAFDLVLANPPYVEDDAELAPSVRDFEPAGALFAGSDGLDAYRVLIPQLPVLLTSRGIALVEIGATQALSVTDLAAQAGLTAALHHDLAGRPRALRLSPG